jgi:hypothetical protein
MRSVLMVLRLGSSAGPIPPEPPSWEKYHMGYNQSLAEGKALGFHAAFIHGLLQSYSQLKVATRTISEYFTDQWNRIWDGLVSHFPQPNKDSFAACCRGFVQCGAFRVNGDGRCAQSNLMAAYAVPTKLGYNPTHLQIAALFRGKGVAESAAVKAAAERRATEKKVEKLTAELAEAEAEAEAEALGGGL